MLAKHLLIVYVNQFYKFIIITQVILAFWLVLAYDLLEDRRTIDVIVTKFFPPCFKIAWFVTVKDVAQVCKLWN